MASDLDFAKYVCEQLSGAGNITYKRMFGEFGIYCEDKIVGVICDNCLFIKKTATGAEICPNFPEEAPYVGAKPHFVVEEIDDKELMSRFIRATYSELPMPKIKKK